MRYSQTAVAHSIPRRTSVIDAIIGLFHAWQRRRRFMDLRHLDDHLLKDIGISREDLDWGARLPLAEDASHRIQARMADRSSDGPERPPRLTRDEAVNRICPWTGKPVSAAALTRYRGYVVGFGTVDALHEFERARTIFDNAIAARQG